MSSYTEISDFEKQLILHCRRSLLVDTSGSVWQKKGGEFDTTMGSLDGAEIAETVGLFLLSKLASVFPIQQFGLYRDDGLMAVQGGKSTVERIKKKVISIFREQSLSITGEGGSKIVDYLDVLFNLEDGSYAPFIKPNTNTRYVSTQSNHPSKIISMIQPNVCKRLSTNSSSKEMFDQHSAHFEQALVEAGHPGNIQYVEPTVPTQGRRTRQRKTIWFNPPFSKNISTNVAAKFLSLVRRHFGKDSKLYSIFNVFNLKVSYCTGPSMMDIISKHNAKVLRKNEEKDKAAPPGCNCQGGAANCPLNGRCLTKSLVYRADVRVGSDVKHYIGQTSNTFKTRWNGHKSDTRCGRARTGLNSYLIDLQRNGLVPDEVRWSKVVSSFPRKRGGKICPLCIEEKVQIAINQDLTSVFLFAF